MQGVFDDLTYLKAACCFEQNNQNAHPIKILAFPGGDSIRLFGTVHTCNIMRGCKTLTYRGSVGSCSYRLTTGINSFSSPTLRILPGDGKVL